MAIDDKWKDSASCQSIPNADLFFPVGNAGDALKQIEEAKAICAECPVKQQCREFALDTGQLDGIWGGMTEDERAEIIRDNNKKAKAESQASEKLDETQEDSALENLGQGQVKRALGHRARKSA